ncbi:MAG: 1-acyl-sn-glycerol-3-phosphate acyltransferase [Actinomycetota bacterium]
MADGGRAGWMRRTGLRRAVSVPTVGLGAVGLAASSVLWAPVAAAADLATAGRRFPRVRTLSFVLAWTALETAGVGAAAALWAARRHRDHDLHYSLQRWWADRLVGAVGATTALRIEVDGLETLAPGPVVLCARHASIADALLPAWLLGRVGMRGRHVLMDTLLADPCLDIVGRRLPNHFVDRDPSNSAAELARVENLAAGMGLRDAAVIFPEGMVVTPAKRERALARIAERDPARHQRVRGLTHLAPVRPGGTAALLRGAPDADLVLLTHTGLESLNRIGDAMAALPLTAPVRVRLQRFARREIPEGDAFTEWLDNRWAEGDRLIAGSRVAAVGT